MGPCAYHRGDMTTTFDPTTRLALPGSDPLIFEPETDIDVLSERWREQAQLEPVTAAEMRGVDVRAQRLGTSGEWLMEQAGTAVAAAAKALMRSTDRSLGSLVLILCGPGNNGGDGLVAARHLAGARASPARSCCSRAAGPPPRPMPSATGTGSMGSTW